jgi:hypothetical protein
MKGTRSSQELIQEARSLSYNETFSYTEGWNNNVAVNILNLALDKLYAALTQIDSPPNVQEFTMDVISQQQAYDLPINVNMALRLIDVRYLYGYQSWEFVTLRQGMIQDRFSYPTNIPDIWCLRNGQILLSPTPNITKPNALIVNYQKRMRRMDIRRGFVKSIIQTSPSYIFQLTFTPPSASPGDNTQVALTSIKNVDMEADAASVLDQVSYVCFVDSAGNAIMDAIPVTRYNSSTSQLYADPNWIPDPVQLADFNAFLSSYDPVYVVQGDYSSTHSELDRQCEDALVEILVLRFLRLTSSAEQAPMQLKAENDVIEYLVNQYRRYRPSVYSVIWQERMRPRAGIFGGRGSY